MSVRPVCNGHDEFFEGKPPLFLFIVFNNNLKYKSLGTVIFDNHSTDSTKGDHRLFRMDVIVSARVAGAEEIRGWVGERLDFLKEV